MKKSRRKGREAKAETVNDALEQFWTSNSIVGNIPDYAGFENWIQERIQVEKSRPVLPLHARSTSSPFSQFIEQVHEAAKSAGLDLTKERVVPDARRFQKSDDPKLYLKSLNQLKLLMYYFNNLTPRAREMFSVIANSGDAAPVISSSASQAEHRVAFFRAVAEGDEHLAFKMVGRLREELHDIGELAFLEATASFHSNRLKEAIRHAREVPESSVDWPRAYMLLLESHALQGDMETVSAEIKANSGFTFPAYFMSYICQVGVVNSVTPEKSLEIARSLMAGITLQSPPGEGAFQLWNRYSCQLAIQLVEIERELTLKDLAANQGGDEIGADGDEYFPLRVRQIACALSLDRELTIKIAIGARETAYQEIVKRLINFGRPTEIDYRLALFTQWRIGDRLNFIENVITGLDNLSADSNQDSWQLITLAYQEASVLRRLSDVEALRGRLSRSPITTGKLSEIESVTRIDRLERDLSPMGRLALRSANWDLQKAEQDSSLWRDAGMLSLGFYRILELEFNERLILPAMHSFDMEEFNRHFDVLNAVDGKGAIKKAVGFWDKLTGPLLRAKQERKGLELGMLEVLLQKIRQLDGPDVVLKTFLNKAISSRLSLVGIEAINTGDLTKIINSVDREKYRNPAAHSRYVDLRTAQHCKQYVVDGLELLIRCTSSAVDELPTIH